MGNNERKRQKRLAKKKQKRKLKKKKIISYRPGWSNVSQMIEQASKMPVYECFVPDEIEETGMGSIIFSRKMHDGNIAFSLFLLDIFCLGVKNAFIKVVPQIEFKRICF